MNKADGQDTADRLSAIVANSLDTQAKTQDLPRQAYQSRTQFHRLFRTVVEETPAAMRRRLLLERAAYQLAHTGMSVTDVALDANYGSLRRFTRAFRKAFRISPCLYRRMHRIFSGIRNRSAWDDTFVDALCEPAETFTFGGVFAHIMTFNAHRRLMALDALRHLGVQTEGFGDPMEYEESVAPWNQRVALKTP
jgi:AraC-like DNA-binding protein